MFSFVDEKIDELKLNVAIGMLNESHSLFESFAILGL